MDDEYAEGARQVTDDAVKRAARGVYGISVTAELSGLDPQTLRLYEQRGLLTPARTEGAPAVTATTILARLQRIIALVGDGVNLAGIAQILALQDHNTRLESDNADLRATHRLDPPPDHEQKPEKDSAQRLAATVTSLCGR